ncbi:MAG: squalene--hopene cyclase [Bryobacterales bacterium]|nr:squalene--hopene cyclase [Bryobacteraceae bacterium]MDW8353965.1 squalene--hopene cyclase [Bryobacterales bacterium]
MTTGVQVGDHLVAGAAEALRRAGEHLSSLQRPEGYWWGELTADTTLESDFILLQLWLYPPSGKTWNPPTRDLVDKAVRSIVARQLPDGGFNIYPKGPADVSATVKAYFALKLAGLPADGPELRRARERILSLGGIQAANSYVKINLSLFGLYPREFCPSVPPEMMLLPGQFIYQMSSWTRAIVIPLSIVQAADPRRPVPEGFTLQELFLPGASLGFRRSEKLLTWRNVFLALDRGWKLWERYGWQAVRRRAVRAAEQWMLERLRYSDGLAAIYPPMLYAIMALDVLGYSRDHPDRAEAEQKFMSLLTDDGERFFFQPCFSPVWDTAIAAFVLAESGCARQESLRRAAEWLLGREVRRRGDWAVKRPGVEPSGWYFEFANEFYPDMDDTAMVLLALSRCPPSEAREAAMRRALRWLVAMQSSDGGWAAFDADNNWTSLSEVPFADHNAMLDPTCPDITGRVLEALCRCGLDRAHRAVRRGVAYLRRTQQPDGSWYGRWGVNYLYGTFLALRGLRAAGEDEREAHILRAGEWIRSIQNADGGWGESCASYDHAAFVPAESTASQTAWAILGLLASGDASSLSVRRGVEYLLETQQANGGWEEELATGTGFPRVFYLTYQLYRISFPLMALAEFLRAHQSENSGSR